MTEPTKQSPGAPAPTGPAARPAPPTPPPQAKTTPPAAVVSPPPQNRPSGPTASPPPVSAAAKPSGPIITPPPAQTLSGGGASATAASARPGGPPPPSPPRADYTSQNPPARAGRSVLPVLCALGFVVLICGLYYLYDREQQFAAALAASDQRLVLLEQRPTPAASDLRPLETRLAALEQQVQGLAKTPPPAAVPRPPTPQATTPPAPTPAAAAPDIAGALAPLSARLAAVEKRVADDEQKATQVDQRTTQAEQQVAQADQRAALAEQKVSQIAAQAATVTSQAERASRIQQAAVALNAGLPLGDIPAAPPALVKYAKVKPPTEAELRLAYPAAANRAAEASRPPTIGQSLLQRMWLHIRSLVTIRDGEKVIVGAPAATVLADAQGKLNAGDIAGAVAALGALDGAAAQAMSGWRDQAQSLLDARAALAKPANG